MAAGFQDFQVTWRGDVFEGAANPSPSVAVFGTQGINFRARKPR